MKQEQSLKDQIKELCKLGNKAGLHDAVEFLNGFINKQKEIERKNNGKKNGR